jgi:hypothetical protein
MYRLFCVVLCIVCVYCVLNYWHRVATQLQLNISYHIISLKQAYLKSLQLRTTYVFGKLLNKVKLKVQHR